jgi:hypothetical protein
MRACALRSSAADALTLAPRSLRRAARAHDGAGDADAMRGCGGGGCAGGARGGSARAGRRLCVASGGILRRCSSAACQLLRASSTALAPLHAAAARWHVPCCTAVRGRAALRCAGAALMRLRDAPGRWSGGALRRLHSDMAAMANAVAVSHSYAPLGAPLPACGATPVLLEAESSACGSARAAACAASELGFAACGAASHDDGAACARHPRRPFFIQPRSGFCAGRLVCTRCARDSPTRVRCDLAGVRCAPYARVWRSARVRPPAAAPARMRRGWRRQCALAVWSAHPLLSASMMGTPSARQVTRPAQSAAMAAG